MATAIATAVDCSLLDLEAPDTYTTTAHQMLAVIGPSYAFSKSHMYTKVALQPDRKRSQLSAELQLATTSRLLRQRTMQQQFDGKNKEISQLRQQLHDQQQQLDGRDQEITQLKQQLHDQQVTIHKQQRRLLKREAQPDIAQVHITCLKEQLGSAQEQLALQQQLNENQQHQLQQCVQHKMQLSADNAHLKAELKTLMTANTSKHPVQFSYTSLLQPTWLLQQSSDASCCCDAAAVISKPAGSDSAAESAAVKASTAGTAASAALEPADSVELPDTPTITQQVYRTASDTSISSDDSSSDNGVNNGVDWSSNSSSSMFSCWWPSAVSSASSSNGLISSDSIPGSWWPSLAATATTSAAPASPSPCSSRGDSRISSWLSTFVSAAAAVIQQAADEENTSSSKSGWWPCISADTADLAAAAATTDALYIG